MRYRFTVAFDEVNYLKLGVSGYLNGLGDILHTYWSPLLPTLISFTCSLFSDYEFAGRMVSILAGTLLVVPVYLLGKLVYDEKVGVVAAAFVALLPPLAFQSTQILTEPIYMLSGTFAIFFGARMLHKLSAKFAVMAGLFSSFAYLAHPQGIGFIMVLAAWAIAVAATRLFTPQKVKMLWLLIPLSLAFLTVSAPYLLYLKDVTGRWTLSAKAGANMQMDAPKTEAGDPFRSLDPSNKVVPVDQIFHLGNFLQERGREGGAIRAVRLKPLLVKYAKNVADILQAALPELFTTVPLILLGIGLLGRPWETRQGIMILYLLSFIAFFWFGLIPIFHINLRYFTPLLPICTLWMARGAIHIYDWVSLQNWLVEFSSRRRLQSNHIATLLLIAAFMISSFLPEFGRVVSRTPDSSGRWADPVDQKKAGLWLKENATTPKVIMSRYHTADIYAGNFDITKSITLPKNTAERVLAYARHRGANYLLLNERYMQDYPKMHSLLSGSDGFSADLKPVYRDVDQAGLATVIYQILPGLELTSPKALK